MRVRTGQDGNRGTRVGLRESRPPKALLNWARKRSRGYYRPHQRRPNGTEEYARCLEHLGRKEAETVEKRGSGLAQREVEEMTRLFYAPGHRAEMNKIPAAAWDQLHQELEDEEAA